MTSVGNLLLSTHATVGGALSHTIAQNASQPKQVIQIINGSTLEYKIKVVGEIVGTAPPKLRYSNGQSKLKSPELKLLATKNAFWPGRVTVEEELKCQGVFGDENLSCSDLEEQSEHSSSPTLHSHLGVRVTVKVVRSSVCTCKLFMQNS